MHDPILPTYELPTLPTYELPTLEHLEISTPKADVPVLRSIELRFPGVPLWPRLIPKWRAAVIESAGLENNIFHNHQAEGNGTLYRPALIQYRCAQGCAVLWGMNEGVDALLRWHAEAPESITLDGRTGKLDTLESKRSRTPLEMSEDWHYYHISDYLALNADNFKKWVAEPRLIGRFELLEKALAAHLLAFCKAAGWWLPERLKVEMVEIHQHKKTYYHQIPLVAFGLTYRCNLKLPDGIALGKATSHGFGVQRAAR